MLVPVMLLRSSLLAHNVLKRQNNGHSCANIQKQFVPLKLSNHFSSSLRHLFCLLNLTLPQCLEVIWGYRTIRKKDLQGFRKLKFAKNLGLISTNLYCHLSVIANYVRLPTVTVWLWRHMTRFRHVTSQILSLPLYQCLCHRFMKHVTKKLSTSTVQRLIKLRLKTKDFPCTLSWRIFLLFSPFLFIWIWTASWVI